MSLNRKYLLSIYLQDALQSTSSLNQLKRRLKVLQPPEDGKKSKSLSVVDALEKAEKREAACLEAEQAATTAWTSAATGKPKKAALKELDAAKKATVVKRNEVQCLRNLLEKEEEQANEQEEEEDENENEKEDV